MKQTLFDSLRLSWCAALLTQVAWIKHQTITVRCDPLQTQFVHPLLVQYRFVSLKTHRHVLLMLWINKQINNETGSFFFLNPSMQWGLVVLMWLCECACVFAWRCCWGNKLRDTLCEQGWNGDSILNGDECALCGWLAVLTMGRSEAALWSSAPHGSTTSRSLTATQIPNSEHSALAHFILLLIASRLWFRQNKTGNWNKLK